ncbi:GNAT family N-acetyltransferase [uncultured Shewanella sp.]|uniref:GNAT family N-acetyltransferase n=1 Tax=uncultured Shewanella sp. TaxID=173975 RepID=UPI00262409D6|nr:GNAT family N-acetyltransferase [uncultured Shewanella sp.]
MEEICIRKAMHTDINAMSALMISSAEKYIAFELTDKCKAKLLASMSTDALTQYFTFHYDYYVAIMDEEIIGVIGMKDTSHLYHLFVADTFYGRGVARLLWQVAKENAINFGGLSYFTVNSAITAQEIYKKWGFLPIDGIRTRDGFSDIPMKLSLPGSH